MSVLTKTIQSLRKLGASRLRALWVRREHIQVDGFAMALSGLCALHCIVSAAFFAVLASAGGFLLDPVIHEIGLGIAIMLAAFALIDGLLRHGFLMPLATGSFGIGIMIGALNMHNEGDEILATILGVAILALAHDLNRRGPRGYFTGHRVASN